MTNKQSLIIAIVCGVLVLAIAIGIGFAVSCGDQNDTPATDETSDVTTETPEKVESPTVDPVEPPSSETNPIVPPVESEPESEEFPEVETNENPPDVVVDILKENEEHEKPVNPSVEGDVVIEDDTKEVVE